jgi:hypothetical protein
MVWSAAAASVTVAAPAKLVVVGSAIRSVVCDAEIVVLDAAGTVVDRFTAPAGVTTSFDSIVSGSSVAVAVRASEACVVSAAASPGFPFRDPDWGVQRISGEVLTLYSAAFRRGRPSPGWSYLYLAASGDPASTDIATVTSASQLKPVPLLQSASVMAAPEVSYSLFDGSGSIAAAAPGANFATTLTLGYTSPEAAYVAVTPLSAVAGASVNVVMRLFLGSALVQTVPCAALQTCSLEQTVLRVAKGQPLYRLQNV